MKIAEYQSAEQPAYDPDAFCTTRQAAARIGVSHRTVQMWVENGTLQAWKTAGGHRRICIASVERLVQGRCSALTAGAPVPARPIIPAAAPARTERQAPSPLRSVLIVEDDDTLMRLYELEISTWEMGIAVRKASNGIEALARVDEARPDLLLSDLHMPGLDGFGMIRALRDNPRTASLPLVVISGLDKPTVLSMGLPEDVPYFTKPAPFAALRAAVVSALPPAA